MRYIFDISDTGGKNVKLTWDLEGENLKDYVDFLVSEGQIEQYDNSNRESLKNILKQFTGTDVWLIIKEEFGDRMTELMQLSGSVIKEESKICKAWCERLRYLPVKGTESTHQTHYSY